MNFDFSFYWSLLLRRLPVMVALFLVCVLIAGTAAYKLPATYSSSARLLVEEPQIPDSMVTSTIQTEAQEQLQVIEQRLLTRANLIDIANEFEVFEDMRSMSPDEVYDGMLRNTRIDRRGGRGQATLMTLEFSATTGQVAANVVNQYVTLILETNSEFRRDRVENTLTFFEQEVRRLSEDLDRQSENIVAFKSANAEALPDDLAYRQDRQSLLQERLARLERERTSLLNQRNEMASIFEATGANLSDANTDQQSREERQVEQLKLELTQALAIYSETNPRVIMLRNRIEQLEAVLQTVPASADGPSAGVSEAQQRFNLAMSQLGQRVEDIEIEISAVEAEIEELDLSIAATAANAIALEGLQRDYANLQQSYNNVLNNLNQARMSERVEASAQGQRITVIENANVPNEPSGPNRLKIAAAGVGGGLGLAVAFFMLLEVLNHRIRRPAELQVRFGLQPIATIPYMETAKQRFMRRCLLVGALLLAVTGVPLALYYIDTTYMPLDILANKILGRLGLV